MKEILGSPNNRRGFTSAIMMGAACMLAACSGSTNGTERIPSPSTTEAAETSVPTEIGTACQAFVFEEGDSPYGLAQEMAGYGEEEITGAQTEKIKAYASQIEIALKAQGLEVTEIPVGTDVTVCFNAD